MDDTLSDGTTISRYRIKRFIDEGGQGKVYLADDLRLGRHVALKILSPDFAKDEKRLRLFEEEAKTASGLNHPNIVTIYEIGKTGSINYIAEEHVDGITLDACIRKKRHLSVREAVEVAIQVASALESAHEKGIIHRDVKPRNIMLRRDGGVKVIDFGIAKLIERAPVADIFASTKTTEQLISHNPYNDVRGTLPYMSPEQMSCIGVDERTDVWSLGVVLYQMVTGRMPFVGEDFDALREAIMTKHFATLAPSLHNEPEGIVKDLEKVISKALRKDRERRYQVIQDLRLDLEDLLDCVKHGPAPEVVPTRRDWPVKFVVGLVVLALTLAAFGYLYMRRGQEPIDSLVVLPFDYVNKSGAGVDPALEEFSESITNRLSQLQLPNFRVAPRITGDLPKRGGQIDLPELYKSLHVRAALTGVITQVDEDDLSISVALIDMQRNSQIWGHRYNRKVSDLLNVQLEILQETLTRLELNLTAEARERLNENYTTNSDAYQDYLRGTYFLNKRSKEGFERGIQAFDEAVGKDVRYAQAYVGLADCYALNSFFSFAPPGDGYPKAEVAAKRAIEIDSKLAGAHASLAYAKAFYRRDWNGAESEFKLAIELNSADVTAHHWYALYLARVGRHDEARSEIKLAQQLDPLSLIVTRSAGLLFYYRGRHDEAIGEFKKVLELDSNFVSARSQMGLAYAKTGRFEQAIAELQTAVRLSPESTSLIAELGWVYAVSGKKIEAQKIAAQLQGASNPLYVSPYSVALVYAGLDDRDKVFEWLDKAFVENSDKLSLLRVDPLFDSLRGDPRFAERLRRVGFPPEKEQSKSGQNP